MQEKSEPLLKLGQKGCLYSLLHFFPIPLASRISTQSIQIPHQLISFTLNTQKVKGMHIIFRQSSLILNSLYRPELKFLTSKNYVLALPWTLPMDQFKPITLFGPPDSFFSLVKKISRELNMLFTIQRLRIGLI